MMQKKGKEIVKNPFNQLNFSLASVLKNLPGTPLLLNLGKLKMCGKKNCYNSVSLCLERMCIEEKTRKTLH